jgi:hypothetical protein
MHQHIINARATAYRALDWFHLTYSPVSWYFPQKGAITGDGQIRHLPEISVMRQDVEVWWSFFIQGDYSDNL